MYVFVYVWCACVVCVYVLCVVCMCCVCVYVVCMYCVWCVYMLCVCMCCVCVCLWCACVCVCVVCIQCCVCVCICCVFALYFGVFLCTHCKKKAASVPNFIKMLIFGSTNWQMGRHTTPCCAWQRWWCVKLQTVYVAWHQGMSLERCTQWLLFRHL